MPPSPATNPVAPIDQFQNLEGIAGRILGYFSQSPTFFVREIFDGIGANAGGAYICSNPVLNIMVYPKHRWYEQIMIPEFSGMKFFEPEIFSKNFSLNF